MASLIHQDGRYYAQFYDSEHTPSRTRIALKTSEKRTAQRLIARAEDAWALGDYDPWRHGREHELFGWEPGPEEDLSTLGKAIDSYLDSCSHLRPDTQRTYREVLRLFEDYVGSDQHVDRMRASRIVDWLDEGVPSDDLADATRRKYVKHLGYLFRYLVEKGAMEEDLSKQVALPKQVERPPKAMRETHQRKLLQRIQAHHQRHAGDGRYNEFHYLLLLIRLNPYMGLRAKELIHLRWQDRSDRRHAAVDLKGRTAQIVGGDGEFETKSGRRRVIPLPEEAIRLLRQARARRYKQCPFVYHHRGSKLKYSRLAHAFYRFRKQAGLPEWVNLHSTRHAYGTRLAEAGTPIKVISKFMGHSTTRVTEQYMHVAPEQGHHYVNEAF
ncbi:tyrosine-type recombinase/integrase [Salinibacter ruber]|uniref:tyrosine-type recombinase/integrase n=1 Tax=Salinibacter ruber TaxID=146919 RepID=UPI0013C35271|nr:site-specific integrase [Salinibacter ruber]